MGTDETVQMKYCDLPQRGKDRVTAAQVIGGFLMDKDHAPWDARDLLIQIEDAGFEIILRAKSK